MLPLSRCCCVSVLGSASLLTAQSILSVPSPAFPTITAAIAAAVPGDTVLVAPGVYVETIDFLGKGITVRSSNGAAATAIDGNGSGPVVALVTNEPPSAVLEGFTIRGGVGVAVTGTGARATAGGIQVVNSSPTIRRCVITGNQGGPGTSFPAATGTGGAGGLQVLGGSVRMFDCEVHANTGGAGAVGLPATASTGGRGGAGGSYFQFATGNAPQIARCRWHDNRGGAGGDAFSTGGTAFGGRAGAGGFELFTPVAVQLDDCTIDVNSGGNGGIATGTFNLIAGRGGDGGLECNGPSSLGPIGAVTLRNTVVVGNRGGSGGAGGFASGGDGAGSTGATAFTAIAVTVAGNTAGTPTPPGGGTGGLTVGGFMVSSATLRNSIFWGNTRGGVPADLYSNGIAASAVTCDLGAVAGTVFGSGSFNSDPLFVNLAAGDVHLTAASPCLHTGSAVPNLPLFDFEGDPRSVGPAPDVGADELDVLAGSREDFTLSVAVNGAFPATVSPVATPAGAIVAIDLRSPAGAFANEFAVLLLEPWLPPLAPTGPAAFPALQVPLGASWFIVLPAGVGPAGTTIAAAIPAGLAGIAARLQAIAITTAAANGLLAATAARDLLF